jgi:hypothetical protein
MEYLNTILKALGAVAEEEYLNTIDKALGAVAEENARRARQAGYLCGDCAELMGGEWPHAHRATFHVAICQFCKACRPIACWDDWNWPKSWSHNRLANQTREV